MSMNVSINILFVAHHDTICLNFWAKTFSGNFFTCYLQVCNWDLGFTSNTGHLFEARKFCHPYIYSHDLWLLFFFSTPQKIADFGLATQLQGPEEKHFTMCGTPNYISP